MRREFSQLDGLVLPYVGGVVDWVEEVGVHGNEDGAHIGVYLAMLKAGPQHLQHGRLGEFCQVAHVGREVVVNIGREVPQ